MIRTFPWRAGRFALGSVLLVAAVWTTGSDTWVPERWASYGEIMAGYRAWLAQLSPVIAAQIANGNAKPLFAAPR